MVEVYWTLTPITQFDFAQVQENDLAEYFYISPRPGLERFLEAMAAMYTLVVYTTATKEVEIFELFKIIPVINSLQKFW